MHEAFDAIAANIRTFTTMNYSDKKPGGRRRAQRQAQAAWSSFLRNIRAECWRRLAQIGLVVDNSDQFVSSSVEVGDAVGRRWAERSRDPAPKLSSKISLEIVELYPYIEYMKFLLSGAVTLAMYVSVMIGGGMLYIDDKARGVHEGIWSRRSPGWSSFGAEPRRSNQSGDGRRRPHRLGSLLAGLGYDLSSPGCARIAAHDRATAVAFNGMMFLMMVRIEDPLVPRAMFGVLNTLLYFPSGAIYPISAFPCLAAGNRRRRSLHLCGAWTCSLCCSRAAGFASIQTSISSFYLLLGSVRS